MTKTSDSSDTTTVRHRRPRAGTRNRGAADAVQTKIAVGVLNLEPGNYVEQLQANITELPDAADCDAAFVALFSDDGNEISAVVAAAAGFAQANPEVLMGQSLDEWSWLHERLGLL